MTPDNQLPATQNRVTQLDGIADIETPTLTRSEAAAIYGVGDRGPRFVDLAAAEKVVGINSERRAWLQAMLEPGGMAPGNSARAHARAFRFAEALMKAGYTVTEAPLGPRGGRRFTLDGYQGPRAGLIYRLKTDRGCLFTHNKNTCDCFDGLTDEQLHLVRSLHRKIRKVGRILSTTDQLAHLIQRHGEDAVHNAVDLYSQGNTGAPADPTIEDCISLLDEHDIRRVRIAISLYTAAGGVRSGGPTVEHWLDLAQRHTYRALSIAAELIGSRRQASDGVEIVDDLLAAIEAAIT